MINDSININGNNYIRTKTTVSIGGVGIDSTNLTPYIKGITYKETPVKEFGYTIGSLRPTHFGMGNITSDGSLTFTDAGLDVLNKIATKSGLPSYLYLGQAGSIMLVISYETPGGSVKTDKLEEVHFTQYENGVNSDDVIYTREVSMMIGKINIGNIA